MHVWQSALPEAIEEEFVRTSRTDTTTLLLVFLALLLTACTTKAPSGKYRVGIAYSTAGKRDNSYSQSAAVGIGVAQQILKIEINEVEPAQLSDLEPTLAALSPRRLWVSHSCR